MARRPTPGRRLHEGLVSMARPADLADAAYLLVTRGSCNGVKSGHIATNTPSPPPTGPPGGPRGGPRGPRGGLRADRPQMSMCYPVITLQGLPARPPDLWLGSMLTNPSCNRRLDRAMGTNWAKPRRFIAPRVVPAFVL